MSQSSQTKSGVINAICAYSLWGVAPIYFKLLTDLPAADILVHRIIWSFVLLIIITLAMGQWRKVQLIIASPKKLLWLLATSIILGINWLVFIWAINSGHILEASLGYYINPLFSVGLGMLFLGERLSTWQKVAVALAFSGVMIQLISLGTIPYIALSLAASFGIYGLMRKKMPVDSVPGLLIEATWMLPLGILYWLFFMDAASSNMMNNSAGLNVTLFAAGIITTAPLLFFTSAAKKLSLTALGFFQYIGPSIMFIIAVTYYKESMVFERLVTFVFIWTALLVFSIDSIKKLRRKNN